MPVKNESRKTTTRPDTEAKVDFLSRPESYPERGKRVDVIETHMSWLFLTECFAHKLKKPALRRYVDLSTVEARKTNCELEVCLNRRLAPEVYLGVIPINLEPNTRMTLSGNGPVVDWLVKMLRLPADRMLDHLIKDRNVRESDLQRFIEKMIHFYATCHRPKLGTSEYHRRLAGTINAHRIDLLHYPDHLPVDLIELIVCTLLLYLDTDHRCFEARVESERIVEGHGDLRPEHICLEHQVSVFDCLEFSADLRTLDVADELAFLTLECERLGGHDEARSILSLYSDLSGDVIGERVLAFYKAARALLRAKLAIWHLDDQESSGHAKWCDLAKKYLELAQQEAGKL